MNCGGADGWGQSLSRAAVRGFTPLRVKVTVPAQQASYFQLRRFPCAIHSTAWATLFARVSGRFASTIHSTYSRRQLGANESKVAAAFGSAPRAARRSPGVA